jgi:hypothetical protein
MRDIESIREQISLLQPYLWNFRYIAGLNQAYVGIDIMPSINST